MIKYILATILFLGLIKCAHKQQAPIVEDIPNQKPPIPTKTKCASDPVSIEMKYGTLTFPVIGEFVTESHLQIGNETIEEHLKMTQELYPIVFKNSWDKVFTPAEGGGKVGQGSRQEKPSIEEEVYRANMYFAKNRPLGEKWLLRRGEKTIVVDMSHELGPPKKHGVAGASSEVIHYLGGNDSIWISKLKDSSLKLGPITCGE